MKNWFLVGLLVLIIGAGSFWGGMQYAGSKNAAPGNFPGGGQQMGQNRNGSGLAQRNGTNMFNGEILSKDDQSITLKLRDGGSKIIFLSKSTNISKMTDATVTDLEIGKNVVVNGTANGDGSVNAQMIQLRNEAFPNINGVSGNNVSISGNNTVSLQSK